MGNQYKSRVPPKLRGTRLLLNISEKLHQSETFHLVHELLFIDGFDEI